jgi:hypothetical protein
LIDNDILHFASSGSLNLLDDFVLFGGEAFLLNLFGEGEWNLSSSSSLLLDSV